MSKSRSYDELFSVSYWNMVWELGRNAFKLKDQGTVLGFLWTLLNPLIYFLVLYNLFVKWMGSKVPEFPLYLIIGIVQWNFFASVTSNAVNAIVSNSSYILSMDFKKSALVLSSVLSNLFSHAVELAALLFIFVIVKGVFDPLWFGIIPLLGLTIYLVVSVSFVLATVGVYLLDLNRIWGLAMSIGFFLTPIFYPMDIISKDKRFIILLNPMTHIIKASRDLLIDRTCPALPGLLYVFIFSTVTLACGFFLFKKKEGYFIEHIYG